MPIFNIRHFWRWNLKRKNTDIKTEFLIFFYPLHRIRVEYNVAKCIFRYFIFFIQVLCCTYNTYIIYICLQNI